MALLRSLKHRPFALLWSGQTISRLGDSLYRIALAWWVLQKTGSGTAVSAVLIFSFAPMLIFLLIGGVVADRFPRVRVMFVSDVLRGAIVALVSVLTFSNRLELWQVYVTSLIFGFVDAFFQPAYTSVVPEITPNEMLPSANSLTALSGEITGIIGPAAGALIIKLASGSLAIAAPFSLDKLLIAFQALGIQTGTATAFALDSLSFFASGACLLLLLRSPVPKKSDVDSEGDTVQKAESQSALASIREGFALVLASPWLWITITIAAFSNFTVAGPINVALPILIKINLGADVDSLGLIFSALSLGAVLGAVWLGRQKQLRRRGLLAYASWIAVGLLIVPLGLVNSVAMIAIIAVVLGILLSVLNLVWANTLQELVPLDKLGRVASVDQLGSFALLPIGFGATGWLTDHIGAPILFVIGGIITAGLALLGLLHPEIRHLD